MARFETWLISDLSQMLNLQKLDGIFFSEDLKGNLIGVKVYDHGEPVTLSGTVVGYILKADGETVAVTGTATQNKASIIMPSNAYNVPGPISIVIKLSTGSGLSAVRTTLAACETFVKKTQTTDVVTPKYQILDLPTLLTKISEMEAKTTAANTAANSANAAASSANTAASTANAISQKLENLTVQGSTLPNGTDSTATVSQVNGHYNISFGIEKGDKGDKGDTGDHASVTGHTIYFMATETATSVPSENDSNWSSSFPTVPQGYYLWTKSVTSWNNNQSTVTYSVSRMGMDGLGSVVSVNNVSPDANGNVELPDDIHIGSTAPSGDETIWIRPDEDQDDSAYVKTVDGVSPTNGNVVLHALNNTGDTMTGDLNIAKTTPALYFRKTGTGQVVGGIYQVVDSSSNNRMVLTQRVDGSNGAEIFFLPTPDTHSSLTWYELLTTKKQVTIAQGGTGANTKAGALTNLGLDQTITDTSNLKTALGNAKFVFLDVPANSTHSYVFASSALCCYIVFVASSVAAGRAMLNGYCNTSGNVSYGKIDFGTSSTFTVSTETNKLKISAAGSKLFTVMLVISGSVPTTE